jgi:NADH:ubiquinone oxidoreductase subunit K
MLGRIGGESDIRRHKALNWIILLFTVSLFTLEITTHILPVFISLEVGLLLVSLKIILLIQSMLKQNHFEFWMLHTIEYRINDLSERFDEIEKKID